MQNTVCIFSHNFKEFFWLLQGEKALRFTKPQGGKIPSDTKSNFITAFVILYNRYQKDNKYQERKKGNADGGSKFRRDLTDCVAPRKKQVLSCLGNVHTHEQHKSLTRTT